MLLVNIRKKFRLPAVSERGMTLIEIMIVLAIMAAVMAGVMVSVQSGRQKTNISRARMDAGTILTYINMERMSDTSAQPSLESLGLSESQTKDPWGQKYQIQYSGDSVKVISGGPDKSVGGDDDVVVTDGD